MPKTSNQTPSGYVKVAAMRFVMSVKFESGTHNEWLITHARQTTERSSPIYTTISSYFIIFTCVLLNHISNKRKCSTYTCIEGVFHIFSVTIFKVIEILNKLSYKN